ncbi:amino acid ABC transporter substrate-binding protein [Aliikangiella marina]|uniref:Amino acid ABC transporter substrate-binding protein n=1 Tax=Aliikangiella marina TaxID=1712262 RepID=A0A545T0Z4_9GAMM|nr:transporter substrate-binding domain-containing protein [Aliikangiella marina]TQV70880.1 amino acid ABC transporter substrate-binding protein [Aliikangiella marina]
MKKSLAICRYINFCFVIFCFVLSIESAKQAIASEPQSQFADSTADASSKTQVQAKVCIDHYPPLQIVKANGVVEGKNIELLELIAERVGFTPVYKTDIPFIRCLHCMRTGNCDVMVGLLDVDDRSEYMDMYQYAGRSDKIFYLNAGSTIKINRYEDLEGLTVGVGLGYRYFEQFDKEESLFEKVTVSTREQLFRMLLSNRIDTFICSLAICENILAKNPHWQFKVVRAAYSYTADNPTYFGLSKKSKLKIDKNKLSKTIESLYSSGQIEQIYSRPTLDAKSMSEKAQP